MSTLDHLVASNQALLDTFPGNHYVGDITGHGDEWRTEFTVDTCPSNESDTQDDEFSLVFTLFETDTGAVTPNLTLDYVVAEVGVQDRHHFRIEGRESLIAQMDTVFEEWDMHNDSVSAALPLVDKILSLKNQAPEVFS